MANGTSNGAVMITGTSSGIGRATALYLAGRGHRVFAGVRKASDADALTASGAAGISPVMIDLTDERSISADADQVKQALGTAPLLGLVNNAGIGVGGPIEFLAASEMRRQLEVNVVGQLAVMRAFFAFLPLSSRVALVKSMSYVCQTSGGRHMLTFGSALV